MLYKVLGFQEKWKPLYICVLNVLEKSRKVGNIFSSPLQSKVRTLNEQLVRNAEFQAHSRSTESELQVNKIVGDSCIRSVTRMVLAYSIFGVPGS